MTEEIKQRINNCKTLDELFELWTNEQKEEGEDSAKDTFPQKKVPGSIVTPNYENFRGSFCTDGVTSLDRKVEASNCSRVRILFVLKEANLSGELCDNYGEKGKSGFWFNEKLEDSTRKKYRNVFQNYMEQLGLPSGELIGYMNLNKRGGYGHTENKPLRTYVGQYSEYIKRQVEIMDPDIILCCGCYDVFMKELYGDERHPGRREDIIRNGRTKVTYVYHPSYYKRTVIGTDSSAL